MSDSKRTTRNAAPKATKRKTPTAQAKINKFLEGFDALSDRHQVLILELIEGFARLYPRDKAESKAKRGKAR